MNVFRGVSLVTRVNLTDMRNANSLSYIPNASRPTVTWALIPYKDVVLPV